MADEDTNSGYTTVHQHRLLDDKKRPLSLAHVTLKTSQKRHLNKPINGSLVVFQDKVFEVVSEKKSKCSLQSADGDVIECSTLEFNVEGKYKWFHKSHESLHHHAQVYYKSSVDAASFWFDQPMLFKSNKDKSFVIDYTERSSNIYEFSDLKISAELLSWDNQLIRCCLSAPRIPDNFNGALILLGILPDEGVVLLGSPQGLSTESRSEISKSNASIYYANQSSKGRGLCVYTEVGRRLQHKFRKSSHYISANHPGSLVSCFYFNKDSSSKEVAWPLTIKKDSSLLTPERLNPLFCMQLLKEMNGSALASQPFTKKRKRFGVENPLQIPQLSSKVKVLLTHADRIFLLTNKGVCSQ